MRIEAAGLTDIGRSRRQNEDSFDVNSNRGFCLVADGMGGHGNGEVASEIAVDTIRNIILSQTNHLDSPSEVDLDTEEIVTPVMLMNSAITAANAKVLAAVQLDNSLLGMGTTVASLLIQGTRIVAANVGDSRIYRARKEEFELISRDHTWVNEQVEAGFLSQEQARSHPLKNVVTRALGGDSEVDVEINELEAESGDVYLLCSDGLTGMLTDLQIQEHLTTGGSLDEACRELIDAANELGGLDNITVVLARVEGSDGSDSSDGSHGSNSSDSSNSSAAPG